MDRILIPDFPLSCRIGVTEHERSAEQEVLADIELGLDLRAAALSDDLDETLDYQRVGSALVELARERPRKLIETLAEDAAAELLSRFPVAWVRVRIKKPSAMANFGAPYAAVEIERRRDG